MKILSVNAGSSSFKFQAYEMPEAKVLISGNFERIGEEGSFYSFKINGEKIKKEADLKSHEDAFNILMEELIENKVVEDLNEIKGVGHRVVQGGTKYDKSVIIDESVIKDIEEYSVLAPLHNPAGIMGIRASQEVIPNAINVAVFDTAFHQTISPENYIYSLPYELMEKYKIRKYGYHGTSHKYVSEKMNEILGRTDTKLITCHIGSGASISAIKNGKCINTSMGLTPNSGLMMGTRCGDIDATIVTYMINSLGMAAEEVDKMMNKQSGLLGVSGKSNDARDIEAGVLEGDERCILAHNMFVRKVINHIAMYYMELGGCDAIVFTAGIGERSVPIREDILEHLSSLGVKYSKEKNQIQSEIGCVTTEDSNIPVYVIPTDEEFMIAKDTYDLAI